MRMLPRKQASGKLEGDLGSCSILGNRKVSVDSMTNAALWKARRGMVIDVIIQKYAMEATIYQMGMTQGNATFISQHEAELTHTQNQSPRPDPRQALRAPPELPLWMGQK